MGERTWNETRVKAALYIDQWPAGWSAPEAYTPQNEVVAPGYVAGGQPAVIVARFPELETARYRWVTATWWSVMSSWRPVWLRRLLARGVERLGCPRGYYVKEEMRTTLSARRVLFYDRQTGRTICQRDFGDVYSCSGGDFTIYAPLLKPVAALTPEADL